MRVEVSGDGRSIVIDDGVTFTSATAPEDIDQARPTAEYRDGMTAAALALHRSVAGQPEAGPAFGLQTTERQTPSSAFDWRLGEAHPMPVQASAGGVARSANCRDVLSHPRGCYCAVTPPPDFND